MDTLKIVKALAAEIERCAKSGDSDRARKLADLQARVVSHISQQARGDGQ
jgi:hypothetical protein